MTRRRGSATREMLGEIRDMDWGGAWIGSIVIGIIVYLVSGMIGLLLPTVLMAAYGLWRWREYRRKWR